MTSEHWPELGLWENWRGRVTKGHAFASLTTFSCQVSCLALTEGGSARDRPPHRWACFPAFWREIDVWTATNQPEQCPKMETTKSPQMLPLPCHPLLCKSHTGGWKIHTVPIKPWSACQSKKAPGKQKDKIGEINNQNNLSPSIRKIHLHLQVTEIYCPFGTHRRIAVYYHMLYGCVFWLPPSLACTKLASVLWWEAASDLCQK